MIQIIATGMVGMFLLGCPSLVSAQQPQATPLTADNVSEYFYRGDHAGAQRAIESRLPEAKSEPDRDALLMALASSQFLQAIEELAQSYYHHGFLVRRDFRMIPLLRLPVTENPDPAPVSHGEFRAIIEKFATRLDSVRKTLGRIESDDWKFTIDIARIQLRLGDVNATPQPFASILNAVTRRPWPRSRPEAQGDSATLRVSFDRGDALWLEGYMNLLMGFVEIALAHDTEKLFNATAHIFFKKPTGPYPFLNEPGRSVARFGSDVDIADVVAMIHLLNFDRLESGQKRMERARNHFIEVSRLSRQSWKSIQAESDDDHEWLPNPDQAGIMGIPISQPMITRWTRSMGEIESILKGDKLVPFWRGDPKRGVNLKRAFLEGKEFDLVLWIQGVGAAPFLEEGTMTDSTSWEQLLDVFGGNFLGFAVWFN